MRQSAGHRRLIAPSIGMIMITICEYGVPHAGVWLLQTMEVMFCIYIAVSMFASAGLYLVLWSTL